MTKTRSSRVLEAGMPSTYVCSSYTMEQFVPNCTISILTSHASITISHRHCNRLRRCQTLSRHLLTRLRHSL